MPRPASAVTDAFGLGWYHYGARFYDVATARWTTMDPADEFHSPYVYVGGDPVNLVDPDGQQSVDIMQDIRNRERLANQTKTERLQNLATVTEGVGIFGTAAKKALEKKPELRIRVGSGTGSASTVQSMYNATAWTAPTFRNAGNVLTAGVAATQAYNGDYADAAITVYGYGVGTVTSASVTTSALSRGAGTFMSIAVGGAAGFAAGAGAGVILSLLVYSIRNPDQTLPNERRGLAPADATSVEVRQVEAPIDEP